MNTNPLVQLKEGQHGKIIRFEDDQMASKLLSMGILPGSKVKVVKIAPFHGGIYLKVDGNSFALRVKEAATVIVES